MRTVPAVGSSSWLMQRSRVDLPEPEGPTSTHTSPERTVSAQSLSTWRSPKVLCRPSISITASHAAGRRSAGGGRGRGRRPSGRQAGAGRGSGSSQLHLRERVVRGGAGAVDRGLAGGASTLAGGGAVIEAAAEVPLQVILAHHQHTGDRQVPQRRHDQQGDGGEQLVGDAV